MEYYAVATDGKGKNFVLNGLSGSRALAVNEAERRCKKQGLTFQSVEVVSGTQYAGELTTKNAAKRKKLRGLESKKNRK